MKKIIAVLMFIGIALTPAIVAGATSDSVLTYPPTSENVHLKATICHWANGNLSEPSVSLNAIDDPQDTGHGELTLTVTGSLASFVPHVDPPGHEQDGIIDIYLKHGDDVVYLYQAHTLCNPEETTTTTEPPVVTTTTEPPVVTTTVNIPVVTTTTEPPVVITTTLIPPVTVEKSVEHNCTTTEGFGYTTSEPNCGAATTPAELTALPRTGTTSNTLAAIGGLIGLTGLMLLMVSRWLNKEAV